MDCFQDFCLFCDRDSPDGPYCSQKCKLADLERSAPSSPTYTPSRRSWNLPYDAAVAQPQQQQQQQQRQHHHHHRPQHAVPSYTAPSSYPSQNNRNSSYFMWTPPASQHGYDERQLTPSSSRTSLSSTSSASASTPTTSRMSAHTQQQLQNYFSSFDQARAAKRRSSLR